MDSVPIRESEVINLKKNLSAFNEPMKLHKNSSSILNNSLLSTKDVNTIKSKNNMRSLERDKRDISKINVAPSKLKSFEVKK